MGNPDRNTGFKAPSGRRLGREHRTAALAELLASIVLALCTVIAVTAVTVGIARADVVGNVIDHETSLFAVALMLGLVFIVIGGIGALPHWPRKSRRG